MPLPTDARIGRHEVLGPGALGAHGLSDIYRVRDGKPSRGVALTGAYG